MKFNYFATYYSLIFIFSGLCLPVTANEQDESRTIKNPINANSLEDSQNAQLLFSDSQSSLEVNKTNELLENESERIEFSLTPLQINPLEPMTVETANTLPKRAFYTTYGANIFGTGSEGAGTGLQVYNGSIDYGISQNLQVGLALSLYLFLMIF